MACIGRCTLSNSPLGSDNVNFYEAVLCPASAFTRSKFGRYCALSKRISRRALWFCLRACCYYFCCCIFCMAFITAILPMDGVSFFMGSRDDLYTNLFRRSLSWRHLDRHLDWISLRMVRIQILVLLAE